MGDFWEALKSNLIEFDDIVASFFTSLVTSLVSLSKVIAETTAAFGFPVSPFFTDSLKGENTGENTLISNAPMTVVLTYLEGKKTSYKYSLLNCIAEQQDYCLLYPSRSKKLDGATPELFLLYQTYILKYPVKALHTAYKIAEYLKSKVDSEKLAVNIERDTKKQNTVKKWIINMG
jgi:hypothetical protein